MIKKMKDIEGNKFIVRQKMKSNSTKLQGGKK